MTACNSESLTFSSLSRKKIIADSGGGHLTSDAGALLLRKANRRAGLIDALAACISDPHDPARIQHDAKTLLAQRVFGIAMGYEDGNDPIMQLLAETPPDPDAPLASPPTLCRFENWVDRKSLARMAPARHISLMSEWYETTCPTSCLARDGVVMPLGCRRERAALRPQSVSSA